MQALAFGSDRQFALRERPVPEPDAGEALLRVHYSGICGTDLHAQSLGHYSADVVIGHEFAGEVAAVGPGVSGWQIGDRVAVHPRGNACGECAECRAGWVNLCGDWDTLAPPGSARDGGMAAYAALPATMLRRLPDEVSMLEGAWVEPLAVALRGVARSGFSVGRRAAVIGAGPIGLLTTLLLRYGGASHIAVLEPSEQRRSKALELGADAAIDPLADDPATIFGSDLPLVDFALECSGARSALDTAADIARPHNAGGRRHGRSGISFAQSHQQRADDTQQRQRRRRVRDCDKPARAQRVRRRRAHKRYSAARQVRRGVSEAQRRKRGQDIDAAEGVAKNWAPLLVKMINGFPRIMVAVPYCYILPCVYLGDGVVRQRNLRIASSVGYRAVSPEVKI